MAGTSSLGRVATANTCASPTRAVRPAGAHGKAGRVPSRSSYNGVERRYATCCPCWQFIRKLQVHDPPARPEADHVTPDERKHKIAQEKTPALQTTLGPAGAEIPFP